MSEPMMVYIHCPTESKAEEIVQSLLEHRLIACANIFSCKSLYIWQGTVEQEAEYIVVAKTFVELYIVIEQKVQEQHPYQTPLISGCQIQVNQRYLQYMYDTIKPV